MSTFERDEFKWRETYFVLFDVGKRPTLKQVERALHNLSDRFELTNARADERRRVRIDHGHVSRRLRGARHQL